MLRIIGKALTCLPYTAFGLTITVIVSAVTPDAPHPIRLAVVAAPVFDDFLGPQGSAPDGNLWDCVLGGGGWGDDQLQTFTNSPDNVRLDGQGHLVIEARRTPTGYTSGAVVTRGKADFLYGTLTARVKLPPGQGLVSGFWSVGSDIDSVGWPQSGEIDIIELKNSTDYDQTVIGPRQPSPDDANPSAPWSAATQWSDGTGTNDFHNYWVTREPDKITTGVDDSTRAVFTPSSVPPDGQWVFAKPFYAIFSIHVGGNWPGPPDDSTPFPATMLVDWFKYTPP
jgi:beta-glucanase (GH16 family)